MIDHYGSINTIFDCNERYKVTEKDKILGISELWFDLSVYDIFGTFAVGAQLIIPKNNFDIDELSNIVKEKQITIWNSVPAFVKLFEDNVKDKNLSDYQSVRLIMMSGDWIPIELPEKLFKNFPKTKIFSMGGATEASIWSILYPIVKFDKNWKSVPYGKPMVNQKFFVFDENLELCPFGVAGELYIGGIGVAKGYWKDEIKTKNSFIIHPKTKEYIYKTGDFGKYMEDESGNIEFLGRKDTQVKIQGFRIELGEIENEIKKNKIIKDSIVNVIGEKFEDKKLIGYLILNNFEDKKNEEEIIKKIKENISKSLPSYMVPKIFLIIDKLPLNSNGKVDRKLLPKPDLSLLIKDNSKIVLPKTDIEKKLVDIWKDVLGNENIGTEDNFFELGGDSIK